MSKNKSFFEKLTGTIHLEDEDNVVEESAPKKEGEEKDWMEEESEEGQLPVDVYQTSDQIIIQTIVAGVRPSDLDISISREMVTIKGRREGPRNIPDENYFHRELYWGGFTRTILLPAEVEVEEAEAIENHGLLIIKLPKIDKERQTKLKVKSNSGS